MSEKPQRVLFVATVVKKHIMVFHLPCLKMFQQMGYETVVAARNDYDNPQDCQIPYCDQYFDIPFERAPFRYENVQCYKQLKALIDEGDFSIIHCHTPVGGVLARLAARSARKKGTRVFYTAHGFHFYRGAPLLNWLLFFPIEKFCARFADAVLTINAEDWRFAKKHFRNTQVHHLPGIGIHVDAYAQAQSCEAELRESLGIDESQKLILSVGELNDNKNQRTVIQALTLPQLENVHYLIVGEGSGRAQLAEYAASLNVGDRVHLLGFRRDVAALLHASDVFVFPSYREGLPVAVMEAMAAGVPVVASRIRGNVDLIEDGHNGFLCEPEDAAGFAESIRKLLHDPALAEQFRRNSLEKIRRYDTRIVMDRLRSIYHGAGAAVELPTENRSSIT